MKSPIVRVYMDKEGTRDISSWVASFQYEDATDKDNQLTLRIHQDRADAVLDDPTVVAKGMVYFQWGYMEGPISPTHVGRITDVNVDYTETITVTLQILDLGHAMKKGLSTEVWQGVTTRQIAARIAERHGLTLDMEFEGRMWSSLAQGNRSDMQLLQYIVSREKGGKYIHYVRGGVLSIVERGTGKQSRRTYTYRKDNEVISIRVKWEEKTADPATNSSQVAGNTTPGQEADPKKGQTDVSTGENVVTVGEGGVEGFRSPFIDATFPTLGDVREAVSELMGQDPKNKKVGKKSVAPTGSVDEAKSLAHGKQNKAKIRVVKATMEVHGEPELAPDQVITLAGLHRSHEGNWYIHSVRHNIQGRGRYTTTLELGRNAGPRPKGTEWNTGDAVKADKANVAPGPFDKFGGVPRRVVDENGKPIPYTPGVGGAHG